MNPIISSALLFMIVVGAWVLILNIGASIIESATASIDIREAERTLSYINNMISEVVDEGSGASRVFKFSGKGEYQSIPEEDIIEYKRFSITPPFDYFSRKFIGNIIRVSGNDVDCYESDVNNDGSTDLVMENSFLLVGFQKIDKTNPLAPIDTKDNILYIKEKTNNISVIPVNSSIVIDEDTSTSYGNGYSELLRKDNDLPRCVAHFFVNSTVSYDIYYELYAGADFLLIEVRNVIY